MENESNDHIKTLNLETLWEKVFTVNPLVIVGSTEEGGSPNFAPKHLAIPMGWKPYFGFVCTPRHTTYQNIKRTDTFTVTYPKPDQVLQTSLTATQRREDDTKPELEAIPRFPATKIDGHFLEHGYLFLECRLEDILDRFDGNSLILGKIVAAHADREYIRKASRDDNDLIFNNPLLAFLAPTRFSVIEHSQGFPFPSKFKK